MVNVCRKMRLISTFRVVLVGVAGFEPATPSSRTPGHTTNVRICQRFCVRLLPSNHDPFRESGRGPFSFFSGARSRVEGVPRAFQVTGVMVAIRGLAVKYLPRHQIDKMPLEALQRSSAFRSAKAI
jgi:hypothetical protein